MASTETPAGVPDDPGGVTAAVIGAGAGDGPASAAPQPVPGRDGGGSQLRWPAEVYAAFADLGITVVAFVPDAGHRELIASCIAGPAMTAVSLTTEEEGIALLAGAWLGGRRGALLMQSSGVGNCPNMLAMNRVCRLPLLLIVTMRGQWGETNPWQVPIGQTAVELLRLGGVITFEVDDDAQVAPTVRAAAAMAFSGDAAVAVVLSQRLLGAKQFVAAR